MVQLVIARLGNVESHAVLLMGEKYVEEQKICHTFVRQCAEWKPNGFDLFFFQIAFVKCDFMKLVSSLIGPCVGIGRAVL